MIRVGIITSHPIQYNAPLFRRLSARAELDVEVLYCHDHGIRPSFDPGFGRTIQFDTPLLAGYRHRFLRNFARSPSVSGLGQINPGVLPVLLGGAFDAVIVYGWGSATTRLALICPRARRTALLLRADASVLDMDAGGQGSLRRRILPWMFRRVDRFLAAGTANSRFYQAYGVDASRISLAPFSVDDEQFERGRLNTTSAVGEARQRLGLATDAVVVLFSGKLVAHKRPHDALRAVAGAGERCVLALAGDGPLRSELEQEAARLGCRDRIRFLGFKNQSELPQVYSACDALIVPSEREPWGLVVNEAMACGLAVAVSDRVGAGLDLVKENGAIFRVGDVPAMSRILAGWAGDPEGLRRQRRASRELIATWGLDQTARAMTEALHQVKGDRL